MSAIESKLLSEELLSHRLVQTLDLAGRRR